MGRNPQEAASALGCQRPRALAAVYIFSANSAASLGWIDSGQAWWASSRHGLGDVLVWCSRMKVLVAETDRDSRHSVVTALGAFGDTEIAEVTNGDEAFEALNNSSFDLVVLSWEVPGRTGLEIVRALRRAGRSTPVVMVTGNGKRETITEAIQAGVSDCIIKPFAPEYLRKRVSRFFQGGAVSGEASGAAGAGGRAERGEPKPDGAAQQPAGRAARPQKASSPDTTLGKPVLSMVLRQIDGVSTIPQMAMRFMQVASNPQATVEDVKAVLANDPALTTRVLRLVNSSAFPVRDKITDLQQAIAYLGLKQVRNLGIAVTVSDLFKVRGSLGPYNRPNLWRHMVSVGMGARLLAKRLSPPNCEEFFLAGLVHDIGIVFEDQYVHQQFCMLVRSLKAASTLVEQERQYLAFDHTTLGASVAEQWGLPQPARAAIRHHHASASCEGEDSLVVRCVELANWICSSQGIASMGMNLVRPVSPKDLGLPLEDSDLALLAQDLQKELAQSAAFFALDA